MTPTATPEDIAHKHSAKRSAALFSVLAALVITVLKILTGVLTGSLGMLSEGVHSSIDLVAAAITFFSVQVADRPADEGHTYGHGKVESLAAFIETVFMLGSCVWILTEAIRRIFFHENLALAISIWPFLVLLLSIAVDYGRSRNLHRIARQYNSEALEADAIQQRLTSAGAGTSTPSNSPIPSQPSSSRASSSASVGASPAAPSMRSPTRLRQRRAPRPVTSRASSPPSPASSQ